MDDSDKDCNGEIESDWGKWSIDITYILVIDFLTTGLTHWASDTDEYVIPGVNFSYFFLTLWLISC